MNILQFFKFLKRAESPWTMWWNWLHETGFKLPNSFNSRETGSIRNIYLFLFDLRLHPGKKRSTLM